MYNISNLTGIELEVEDAAGIDSYNSPLWRSSSDASLRNYGVELKSTMPLTYKQAYEAIDEIEGHISDNCSISTRCSLHIHRDVNNIPYENLAKILVLYLITERFLYKVSGCRDESNFCIPIGTSPLILRAIRNIVNGRRSRNDLTLYKYSGLNLGAMRLFNSLEFRMHEGTKNPATIRRWLDITTCVMNAALSTLSCEEMIDRFWEEPLKTFHLFFPSTFGIEEEVLIDDLISGCEVASLTILGD